MKSAISILAAIFILQPGLAGAQGFVKSYACSALPADLRVDVQVADDTPPMLRVRDAVVKRLRQRNVTISDTAPLRMLIDPENLPESTAGSGRDLTPLEEKHGATLDDRTELDNRLESLRERRSQTEALTPAGTTVRLSITINAKSDGKCMWQGEARHEIYDDDYWKTLELIAPVLVNAIGKALDNRPFDLN